MSVQLDALQAQSGQTVDKIQEAILLLGTLSAMIADLKTGAVDLTKIDGITQTLKAVTDSLSAAITANTPAPPAP